MEDTLEMQRRYFDKRLKPLCPPKEETNEFCEILDQTYGLREMMLGDLSDTREFADFAYRSGLIRGKIIGLGLEKHMEDIIDGMNISANK